MRDYVHTQAELDDALAQGKTPECVGRGPFRISQGAVIGRGSTIIAEGKGVVYALADTHVQATGDAVVYAHDNSDVKAVGRSYVIASDESRIRASDHATVYATHRVYVSAHKQAFIIARSNAVIHARDACRIDAGGTARVIALDRSRIIVQDWASVQADGRAKVYKPTIAEGEISLGPNATVVRPALYDVVNWCVFYGVKVSGDTAILYKAVDEDYSTSFAREVGIYYKPGAMPEASDWDDGKDECGGGLHFSPAPIYALDFYQYPAHFIACPVRLKDMRSQTVPVYPSKIKAQRVCQPCFEVDIRGEPCDTLPHNLKGLALRETIP